MPISDFFAAFRAASARSSAMTPSSSVGAGRVERTREADAARHRLRRELLERGDAERVQHGGDVRFLRPDMAADEGIAAFEFGELGERVHHSVSTSLS